MPDPTDKSILRRLKERKLVEWALAYLAGAWLVLQVLDVTAEPWGLSAGFIRAAQAALLVGFLVTLVLAWYHGEKGRQRVSGAELTIIGALLLACAIGFRIFASGDRVRETATADADAVAPAQSGVAVLPFVNMSGDPDNEYFSDGITEELLNTLAQIPGLRVPARTSSFAFKDQALPIRRIADTLGVTYVLEGSVRRDGDRVLITAQLVDAQADAHLWSNTFERRLEDVFAIQREIATAIAGQLRLTISGDQRTRLTHETASLEAHDYYLRGRQLLYHRSSESMLAAIEAFRSALAADPSYAPAHAGLANAFMLAVEYAYAPRDSAYAWVGQSLAHADRAIALDRNQAEAYAVRGFAAVLGPGEPAAAAEDDFRRALELQPSSADALGWYGQLLSRQGRVEETRGLEERSLQLDPVAPGRRIGYAAAALWIRDAQLALDQVRRARAIQPDLGVLADTMEGFALLLLGRSQECLDLELPLSGMDAICMHGAGRAEEAAAIIDSIARAREPSDRVDADLLAAYYAWTEQPDEALRWVERGLQGSPAMPSTRLWPAEVWDRAISVDSAAVRSTIARLSGGAWDRIDAERRRAELP